MKEQELRVGDRIRDNDPRVLINRILTVTELLPNGVVAKDRYGKWFRILRHRIHTDGKPRRSGFSLVVESEDRQRA